MAKTIQLTRGRAAIVSDEDFERLSAFKWHAHKDVNGFWRAYRHDKGTRNKSVAMVADIVGKKDGMVVDHINRDSLDNRRENLRWATVQENCRNRIRPRRSGLPPGVFKNGSGFSSRITLGAGKRLYLGCFESAQQASEKYIEATKQFFGAFSAYSHGI